MFQNAPYATKKDGAIVDIAETRSLDLSHKRWQFQKSHADRQMVDR